MMAEWNLSDRDYELLSAYLDGALAAAERQALEQRLAVEPALRAELAALQETVTLLNQLPPRRAPRDFTLTPAMVGRETGLNRGLFSLVTSPAFSAVTAAAAVFLVVLGAFVLLQGVGTSIMPQSALAPVANQPTSEVISGGILAATRTLPGEANSQRSAANTSAPTPELQTEMLYAVPLATQTAAPTMPPPSPLPTLLAATSLPFTQALPAP
jgi:anti-sigma factor RsiW